MVKLRCLSVFILVCSLFSFSFHQVLAEGTYSSLGTGDADDGSNDAINFSQGRVWTIDKYGKYIWSTQGRSGPTSHWAWSNDDGATWSQSSEGYSFLTRASVAYDSINDVLHVIWSATDSNDGIIYRRYSITRDGSNNITSIQRMNMGVNLQLDTSSSRILEEPVAIWVNDGTTNGSLVAVWSKHGSSLNEVRGSMRHLSMTDDDGVAGNWIALDGSGDTFGTDAPAVSADKIYGDNSGSSAASAKVRGGSGSHKDDLYVFVAEQDDNSGDQLLGFRGTWNSGNHDWSGGWTSLGAIGAMDTTSGYNLKYQLVTKPVIDTINDRLYVGWARWKTGGEGDTVSIAYLDSADSASSTVDVYSANGTHGYAPTIDISYDSTLGLVYAAYIESTTNGTNGSIDYKSYDGSTLSTQTRFYTSPGGTAGADGGADIPILYENRSNNRLLIGFRINGALPPTGEDPHFIYWGYETLATPTPTPTPTPTSTPVPTATPGSGGGGGGGGSSGGGASSEPSTPQCTDSAPSEVPYIGRAIAVTANQVDLIFSSWSREYTLEYGTQPGTFLYAVSGIPGGAFSVRYLAPNTTYYFRVAAKNGCTVGPWSNTVKARTRSALTVRGNSVVTGGGVIRPTAAAPRNSGTSSTTTPKPTAVPIVPQEQPQQSATKVSTAPSQPSQPTATPTLQQNGFFSSIIEYIKRLF